VPHREHDPRRVEQLWLALHRGPQAPKVRCRVAGLIAASALLRNDIALTAHALAHTDDNRKHRASTPRRHRRGADAIARLSTVDRELRCGVGIALRGTGVPGWGGAL